MGTSPEWQRIQGSISDKVVTELRDRKWTQRELAARSGVPENQVSRLLNNRTDWWLRDMWRISKALGVPIDDLVPVLDATE